MIICSGNPFVAVLFFIITLEIYKNLIMKRTTTIFILLLAVFSLFGYTTTFDSPDQNAFGVPVDTTKYKKPELTLKVNEIDFLYEGTHTGETTIKGTMTQMGQSLELNLTKKEE